MSTTRLPRTATHPWRRPPAAGPASQLPCPPFFHPPGPPTAPARQVDAGEREERLAEALEARLGELEQLRRRMAGEGGGEGEGEEEEGEEEGEGEESGDADEGEEGDG